MISYFVYARKSTESGDRQALSIEAQINELTSLAQKEQLKIAKIFTESQSAKNSDRPVFGSMVNELKRNRIRGILCWKLDRLTRNLSDAARISDLLEKGVIDEIRTPMQIYRNNSIDRLMSGIDFLFARKFIDDLSENVKRGLRLKVQQGWMPGRAPIGYLSDQADKGFRKIIPDPERFPLIRKMWDMMLSCNYSVPQILSIANKEWGFKTRRTKRHGAAPLYKSTLYKVFTDPFYYGCFVYQGELHQGKHKPMVTFEEFEQVQQLLGTNNKSKPQEHTFDFTGLFRCGQCNSLITAERKYKLLRSTNVKKSYIYYHCTHGKNPDCQQGSVTDINLLDQIDGYLSKIAIPREHLEWIFKYYDAVSSRELNKTENEKRSIKKELQSIDKKLQNLMNLKIAPENEDNQLLSDEEYLKQKNKLIQEKQSLDYSLNNYDKANMEMLSLTKETFELSAYARIWLCKGDKQRKQTIIRKIFSNRKIVDKTVLMKAKRPFELISDIQLPSNGKIKTFEPTKYGLDNTQSGIYDDGLCALLRQLDDIRTEIVKMAKENGQI
ncbi:MAG: recombinase family protein [Candidatus Zixiibacteriota bacterium]